MGLIKALKICGVICPLPHNTRCLTSSKISRMANLELEHTGLIFNNISITPTTYNSRLHGNNGARGDLGFLESGSLYLLAQLHTRLRMRISDVARDYEGWGSLKYRKGAYLCIKIQNGDSK